MTLRKRWCSNTVISTDGWAIAFSGRSAIVYWDKISRVYVSAEALAVGMSWVLYPKDMYVGSLNGEPLADDARRGLIVDRIRAAFKFLHYKLEVC